MSVRTCCYTLILLLAGLLALCWLPSCRAEKAAPEKESAETAVEPEVEKEPQIKEQRITVGDAILSLPAPEGFVSVSPESLAEEGFTPARNEGGILLCAFARKNFYGSKHAPLNAEEQGATEDSGNPEPGFVNRGKLRISVEEFDVLRVGTLNKWLHEDFSAEGFDALKTRLKNNSVVCDAQTVSYFIEASRAGLAGLPSYTYNLGLSGHGNGQISFAAIVKTTGSGNEALYICTVRTLLYCNGKILRLEYDRRIEELTEILPTLEDHLSYLVSNYRYMH